MVELWLVVEPQVNNTLYWAKEFFYSASFSVEGLNEIGEYNNNQWYSVVYRIFLLTGFSIYKGEYKAQGPKGGHYKG